MSSKQHTFFSPGSGVESQDQDRDKKNNEVPFSGVLRTCLLSLSMRAHPYDLIIPEVPIPSTAMLVSEFQHMNFEAC